jgi:hypothetical protein
MILISKAIFFYLVFVVLLVGRARGQNHNDWLVDSTKQWQEAEKENGNLTFADGLATPTADVSRYRSVTYAFEKKRSAKSIVIEQSPRWHNWNAVSNIGPSNLEDAPVLLTVGPDNYWMFGRYGSGKKKKHFNIIIIYLISIF